VVPDDRDKPATNLIGPANLSFLAARIMMVSGGGRVVNISSRGAFCGEPETPAYDASKAGLNAMSQSLAQALAPHGVFFYVVAPGFVETDMADALLRGPEGEGIRSQSPLGRVATPEEVARTVAFLASEAPDVHDGCHRRRERGLLPAILARASATAKPDDQDSEANRRSWQAQWWRHATYSS
jgi:NAD(P)-dependent dehydrogenase (short-subunit alcohol dehydrogenase family)